MTKTVILHGTFEEGQELASRLLLPCPLDKCPAGSHVMSESISIESMLDLADTWAPKKDCVISLGISCKIKCKMYHFCHEMENK